MEKVHDNKSPKPKRPIYLIRAKEKATVSAAWPTNQICAVRDPAAKQRPAHEGRLQPLVPAVSKERK